MDKIQDILNKAEILKSKENFREATKILEDAIIKYNNEYKLYEELADIYLYKWELEKAAKSADFALEISPDSATWNYLKWFILLSDNKISSAIQFLEKSNSIMKNNPEVLRNLWWAYTISSQTIKWIIILKRALNIAPKDELITKDLAIALIWEWKVKEWNKLLTDLWINLN